MPRRRYYCGCLLLGLQSLLCHCLFWVFLLQFVLVFLSSLLVLTFSGGGGVSVVDDVFGVGSCRTEVLVGQDLTEDGFGLKQLVLCSVSDGISMDGFN